MLMLCKPATLEAWQASRLTRQNAREQGPNPPFKKRL